MPYLTSGFISLIYLSIFLSSSAIAETQVKTTSFQMVRDAVFSKAYDELPQYEVERSLFDKGGRNLLFEDAKRTLESDEDLIVFGAGQKLLQANGICFSGRWMMKEQSEYSGFYSAGTELPVIARASVSLGGTKQSDKRAFAMAIKVFPSKFGPSQNIFVMHSLGGVKTQFVLDLSMDNEPELGSLPPWTQWLTAYRLEADLEAADELYSHDKANARFRPVSHLARVKPDGSELSEFSEPHWVRLDPTEGLPRVDRDDFRNELSLKHYTGTGLSWDIFAASYHVEGKSEAQWNLIGQLRVDESIVSKSCDTQLHFKHPAIK